MTDLKQSAKRVFLDTLNAIEPDSLIRKAMRIEGEILSLAGKQIPLDGCTEAVVVGMGKASLKMGAAIEDLLADRFKRGILVTDRRSCIQVRSEVLVAGHPLPDTNSLIAGARIVDLVRSCDEHSLVIFLVSGGGSALVELPVSRSISLDDLRITNHVLIGCGASIREINIIRKSLSQIKGGRLGRLAQRSRCIGLYVSDVNPGDIRSIASNPVLSEEIGYDEIQDVVNRFSLLDKLPGSVAKLLQQKCIDHEWQSAGSQPITALLIDNSRAMHAAADLARQFGFRVEICADLIEGEYRAVSDRLIESLLRLRSCFPNERVCVISGGEAACPVRSDGVGGRNQEFVLYSAARLASSGIREGAAVLSCGTDGIDGNSKAAGAVADPELVIEAARRGIDASIFISNNDSHSFFRKAGGLVVTGPSGNNVRDLRILMAQ